MLYSGTDKQYYYIVAYLYEIFIGFRDFRSLWVDSVPIYSITVTYGPICASREPAPHNTVPACKTLSLTLLFLKLYECTSPEYSHRVYAHAHNSIRVLHAQRNPLVTIILLCSGHSCVVPQINIHSTFHLPGAGWPRFKMGLNMTRAAFIQDSSW